MKKRILWITRTAVFIALLITLQALTAAGGQFVTGSLVNLILILSVLTSGIWTGITVALVSPFMAFLLGIGPKLIQIVPFIAVGNIAYILVAFFIAHRFIAGRNAKSLIFSVGGVVAAALVKFGVLYLGVVKIFIAIMGDGLKAPQIETFTAMFSFPQLITALIGGIVAVPIAILLNRAIQKAMK